MIRDASQVLVIPSYKNCLDGRALEKQVEVLYAKDANHRAELTFLHSDQTLNAVARVELKDAKLKASYEVLDLGNGQFALRLRPGAKVKTGTVALNLFFAGSSGEKPNAAVAVKVEIR